MDAEDKTGGFLEVVVKSMDEQSFISLTLSQPRERNGRVRSLFFRPLELRNQLMVQMVVRYHEREETKNLSRQEFLAFASQSIRQHFGYAHLITAGTEGHLLISKRGFVTLKWKKVQATAVALPVHNKEKNYVVPPDAPFLRPLGISSSTGAILKDQYKKYKQISRYIELFAPLTEGFDPDKPLHIVDMGCGKGYLTFAMHQYLLASGYEKVRTTGIDIKEDVVRSSNNIAKEIGYSGLDFVYGRIEETKDLKPDILIALHACDTATDDAILYGLQQRSKVIIVAPCCHKQVRQSMERTDLTTSLFRYGIIKERFATDLTDLIRANVLRYNGYQVKVMEFVGMEHTPKNIMITAEYHGQVNEGAMDEIREWMRLFGVERHYLVERLQGGNSGF